MMDASSCPEDANSTDCLLRVLLQRIDDKFEEYDWDPITFGFTVPVGIIAALFAAFTIYQAVITTSRGSRKSNKRAIGGWSSKTTKRWDWHELCRISTAQTPILTTSNLLKIPLLRNEHPDYENEPKELHEDSPPSQSMLRTWMSRVLKMLQTWVSRIKKVSLTRVPILTSPSRRATKQESTPETLLHDPAVASWLGFLDELGLHYSSLTDIPLMGNIADYLPSDLLAVPAYAEVGFIVAAAAAAGAHSWKRDVQSGYPTVLCRSFQFEFRQHQILGTVGAFTKYSYNPSTQHRPTAGQLVTAILHSRGELEIDRFWRDNYVEKHRNELAAQSQFNTTHPTSKRLFNILGVPNNLFIKLIDLDSTSTQHNCRSCLCGNPLASRFKFDKHNLTWLFVASTPLRPPVIFPSGLIQSPHIFTFLACHSRFWTSINTMRLFSSVNEQTPTPNLIPSLERWHNFALPTQPEVRMLDLFLDPPNDQTNNQVDSQTKNHTHWLKETLIALAGFHMDLQGPLTRMDRAHLAIDPLLGLVGELEDPQSVSLLSVVLEASLKFLYGVDNFYNWFSSLDQQSQQYIRGLILLQIQQINKFLARFTRETLICQMHSLWATALILLDVERAIADGSFGFLAPKAKQNPSGSDDPHSRFPDHLPVRLLGTLQTLSQLLDELTEAGLHDIQRGNAIDKMTPEAELRTITGQTKESLAKYVVPLSYLGVTNLKRVNPSSYYKHSSSLVRVLNDVLETCCESTVSNKTLAKVEQQPERYIFNATSPHSPNPNATTPEGQPHLRKPGGEGKEMPPKDEPEGEKSKEDTIRDVLIWKYILLGMLFSTAPDNSDLLKFGLWERVVPIL